MTLLIDRSMIRFLKILQFNPLHFHRPHLKTHETFPTQIVYRTLILEHLSRYLDQSHFIENQFSYHYY